MYKLVQVVFEKNQAAFRAFPVADGLADSISGSCATSFQAETVCTYGSKAEL